MRRPVLAALLAVLALLSSPPSALAAAKLDVKDADVVNLDGQKLTRVPIRHAVRLVAEVTNGGDAKFEGSLEVVFNITSESGGYELTRRVTQNNATVDVGKTTQVNLTWVAEQSGKHNVQVSVAGHAGTTFQLSYVVAESEVVRGSLLERMLGYGWVYAGLLAAVVLFVTVVRSRKAR